MGGGSYAGFLFGNELVFESDSDGENWGEKRHIFCYGECASTSPSFSPSKSPSFSPSKRPTPVPTEAPIRSGTGTTFCNATAAERIFRLELTYEDASRTSWKLNEFDITSETFVDFEDSGDSVQRTQRICVPPGTYEIIISDSSATGMGGGSYAGFLFGNELVFESDSDGENWGEKRHIFCYGECASTSPSLSPSSPLTELPSTLPSVSPSTEPTPLPSVSPSSQPSPSPSVIPSNEPSHRPSLNPSQIPSLDPSVEPTPSPTQIIELPLPGGQQDAEIDDELNVPSCSTASSSCSTGGLVAGRGKLGPEEGPEQNAPNSLDGCTDSDAGNYNISESIEAITVSSNTPGNMREGDSVTVTATVICWYTGANDTADFYYTTIVGQTPVWFFIDSVDCSGVGSVGKKQQLSVTYSLPKGRRHAVRVNFSYRVGDRVESSSCVESTGENEFYNDVDDLVFAVEENTEELLI